MAGMTLSTKNAQGTIERMFRSEARIRSGIKRVIKKGGELELQVARALAPVDEFGPHPGYMRDHIRLTFSRAGFSYTLGWHESDFTRIGEPFYPLYQEFGTTRHPAQPSLFPARQYTRPIIERELRDAIREATR